jgi:hypothetical protein
VERESTFNLLLSVHLNTYLRCDLHRPDKTTYMMGALRTAMLAAMLALFTVLRCVQAGGNAPLFDVCAWMDAIPELYYDYYGNECPPINSILPNGFCDTIDDRPCNGFCQIKTTFHYGEEQPFDIYPDGRGPSSCTISSGTKVTYSWKFKGSTSWKVDAINLGINGGYSKSGGMSQGWNLRRELAAGEWYVCKILGTRCKD